jgi:hypothetical protein
MLSKQCNKCGQELPLCEFSKHSGSNYLRPECKKCNNTLSKQRKELKKIHGSPSEDYQCPICKKSEKEISSGGGNKSSNWVLDHDHETSLFRGWLCNNCNMGLGSFKDDVEILNNAIEYLKNDRL